MDIKRNTTKEIEMTGKTNPSFWFWDEAVSPEVCDSIIENYYDPEGALKARTEGGFDESYRKTDICWIPHTEAISLFLFSRCLIANSKAGWDFDIESHENTQIAKYEDSGFYDWHTDETYYNKLRVNHRKVSTLLFLSDPSTYTGGELLFEGMGKDASFEQKKGRVVCFPAEVRHKVMPVTSGFRYSLASWATGPYMR
jgi:PKHD-type hydroxylase